MNIPLFTGVLGPSFRWLGMGFLKHQQYDVPEFLESKEWDPQRVAAHGVLFRLRDRWEAVDRIKLIPPLMTGILLRGI